MKQMSCNYVASWWLQYKGMCQLSLKHKICTPLVGYPQGQKELERNQTPP